MKQKRIVGRVSVSRYSTGGMPTIISSEQSRTRGVGRFELTLARFPTSYSRDIIRTNTVVSRVMVSRSSVNQTE